MKSAAAKASSEFLCSSVRKSSSPSLRGLGHQVTHGPMGVSFQTLSLKGFGSPLRRVADVFHHHSARWAPICKEHFLSCARKKKKKTLAGELRLETIEIQPRKANLSIQPLQRGLPSSAPLKRRSRTSTSHRSTALSNLWPVGHPKRICI